MHLWLTANIFSICQFAWPPRKAQITYGQMVRQGATQTGSWIWGIDEYGVILKLNTYGTCVSADIADIVGNRQKLLGGKIVFRQKSLNLAFRSEPPKHFGWHMFRFDISRNILHVLFSCFVACFINKRCTICGWWVRVKDKYEILKATEPSVDYMLELCVGSVWASFSFSSVSAQ